MDILYLLLELIEKENLILNKSRIHHEMLWTNKRVKLK